MARWQSEGHQAGDSAREDGPSLVAQGLLDVPSQADVPDPEDDRVQGGVPGLGNDQVREGVLGRVWVRGPTDDPVREDVPVQV